MSDNLRVALFGSGEGSSIKYVLNYLRDSYTNFSISDLLVTKSMSNDELYKDLSLVLDYNLKVVNNSLFTPNNRVEFEKELYDFWRPDLKPNVIFLLGWKYIMSKELLDYYSSKNILVINLHPALPDSYIGDGGTVLKTMYSDIKNNNIESNVLVGSHVHIVTPVLDRGYILDTSKVVVGRSTFDSESELSKLIKLNEKPMILNVLFYLANDYNKNKLEDLLNKSRTKYIPFYKGKVRSVTDLGYNLLLMTASNRVSAFDRHLTNISDKGVMLNKMSAWWFNKTRHIIPNHYLYSQGEHMVVSRCKPIMLEVVVRSYMTGSSSTSIWTKYNNGERNMYGVDFRHGYKKNEKLDNVIITPTTKGVVDIPITREEIIEQGILTSKQTDYVYGKARELFEFGSLVAAQRGLILVDTKYEFGFLNDQIILMDEVHTCDSSRYWKHSSYQELFDSGKEPEKLDKDCIRDYVKSKYTNDEIKTNKSFDIPDELRNKVNTVYNEYYQLLTQYDQPSCCSIKQESFCDTDSSISKFVDNYFLNHHRDLVVIIAGSVSDKEHVEKIKSNLKDYNIYSKEYYKSAHKNTLDVMNILSRYDKQVDTFTNRRIVFVTVAGRSNALSGVVASNVKYPVIACPPFKDKMDLFTNINSTLQCPSKVPVLTVLEPLNVAISIRYMFDNV